MVNNMGADEHVHDTDANVRSQKGSAIGPSFAEVRQPTMMRSCARASLPCQPRKNHNGFAGTPTCKASSQRKARYYLLYCPRAGVTGMSCETSGHQQ